jgi:hypothetical protein
MHQSGHSRFENGWGSFPSWSNFVSGPDLCFPEVLVVLMVSTALAVASGIFRENKHRSWSRAANLAVMRYLFNQKWDIYTLQSFIGATTTQVYQAWAAQEKIEALTDILPEKAKLHWIGPRQEGSQGRVLLYFFGEVWLISVFCTFTDLYSQEEPSACLHDPTISHSYTLSRKLYPLRRTTLASPLWSTVSSLALSWPSRHGLLSIY